MKQYKVGDKVKAKSSLRDFYYWPELPEYFIVKKVQIGDTGISLNVLDPNHKDHWMSTFWFNSVHFVQ